MADDTPAISQIQILKRRAEAMGVTYHPSIGVDKLKAKIAAKIGSDVDTKIDPMDSGEIYPQKVSESQKVSQKRREANKLIRIRLTCLNPNKKEWHGEIFSVGNSKLGFFKKFIPYDNEEGWHVPRIILNYIQDKNFQTFTTRRDEKGNKTRESKLVREFAIEVMTPLTPDELEDLAKVQTARI